MLSGRLQAMQPVPAEITYDTLQSLWFLGCSQTWWCNSDILLDAIHRHERNASRHWDLKPWVGIYHGAKHCHLSGGIHQLALLSSSNSGHAIAELKLF